MDLNNTTLVFNNQEKALLDRASLSAKIWQNNLPDIIFLVNQKITEIKINYPTGNDQDIRQFVQNEIKRQFPLKISSMFELTSTQQPFEQEEIIDQNLEQTMEGNIG